MVTKPRTSPTDFQAGISIVVYANDPEPSPTYAQLLDDLTQDNVNSLAIAFPVYTDGVRSNAVHPGPSTPPDTYLASLLDQAKARGFSVLLRPILDEASILPSWRGQIQPASPSAWFASYGQLILSYARLAQQHEAASLGIGTELNSMESNVEAWRSLIAQVRQLYSGLVTYSVNWGMSFRTGFWSDLDFLSVDAYFPLNQSPDQATVPQMANDWQRWVDLLKRTDQPFGKPIVFTEVGVAPRSGAHRKPWNAFAGTRFDLDEQRAYYEATCGVAAAAIQGIYWWVIGPAPPFNPSPDDYTPLGRPAEGVMQSCYARVEGLTAPAAASSPSPA